MIAGRLFGLVLACAGIVGAGPVAAQADAVRTLPGKRVAVGGQRMYLECRGQRKNENAPTVVLDAGLGDSSLVWTRVMPELASMARVCSYDRAGYGASDAAAPPRTSAVIVEQLRQLLLNAGIEPPYLLVGHSFGGWNMQLFAASYPDAVAGLVLVDSSQVGEIDRYEQELGIRIAPAGNTYLAIQPYIPPDLPPEEAAYARTLVHDPITLRTVYYEWRGFRASERQVAQALPLPNVPIVVMSRGRTRGDTNSRKDLQERLWRRLQEEFVAAHPGAIHLVAHRSGHYIQLAQPTLVAHGICLTLRRIHDDHRYCAPPADKLAESGVGNKNP